MRSGREGEPRGPFSLEVGSNAGAGPEAIYLGLTAHFRVEEFACGDGTPYPRAWIATRLRPLCEALEALRSGLGARAVVVTSGYRTPSYNRSMRPVRGARKSKHLDGIAADVVVNGRYAAEVQNYLAWLMKEGRIPLGGIGAYDGFTHYDTRGKRVSWGGSRSNN